MISPSRYVVLRLDIRRLSIISEVILMYLFPPGIDCENAMLNIAIVEIKYSAIFLILNFRYKIQAFKTRIKWNCFQRKERRSQKDNWNKWD